MKVKIGSRWCNQDGNVYHVMSVIEAQDGHTWVHYEQDGLLESRTFSCWIDSFVERFSPIINEARVK